MKIYIGMSADLLHPGHLNIIEHARKIIAGNGNNGETWGFFFLLQLPAGV